MGFAPRNGLTSLSDPVFSLRELGPDVGQGAKALLQFVFPLLEPVLGRLVILRRRNSLLRRLSLKLLKVSLQQLGMGMRGPVGLKRHVIKTLNTLNALRQRGRVTNVLLKDCGIKAVL